jgi:hypothetical protein
MKAIRATKKVESLGFPKFYQFKLTEHLPYPIEQAKTKAKKVDKNKAKSYLAEAIDAWRERAEFVESIKGTGTMTYYSYHKQFDPSNSLNELLDCCKETKL